MFWSHHQDDFDREKFEGYLLELIVKVVEQQMADLSKLQADVDAQGPLITALADKVKAQGARIAELEAQVASAPPADPQAPVDDVAAKVEANNAALTAAAT